MRPSLALIFFLCISPGRQRWPQRNAHSLLGKDIHEGPLGLKDGAATIDQTLALCRRMERRGFEYPVPQLRNGRRAWQVGECDLLGCWRDNV